MAITHAASVKTTIANAILAAIDAGSGAGKVVLKAGATTIATLPLSDPAGTVASGVLTIDITPVPEDTSADATGTVTTFEIQDSTNAVVISGTVTITGGGGDLTMPNPAVTAGEPIELTSLVYQVA